MVGKLISRSRPAYAVAAASASRWRFGLLGALLVLCSTNAAGAQTEQDFQIWSAAFVTAQLRPTTPSPRFWFDAHARRGEAGTVLILRPGLGYAFNAWGSIWVGYAWTSVFSDATNERVDGHGLWEQLTLTYRRDTRVLLQSRTRAEQFWSELGSEMFPRLRQFGRFNWRPSGSTPVGLAVWDEVFFGLKQVDWGHGGFFENRIFAGLAIYSNSKLFRVEPGYMFVNRNLGSRKTLSHVLALNFFVSFKPQTTPRSGQLPDGSSAEGSNQ